MNICPVCGTREALEDAMNAGAINEESAKRIIEKAEEIKE